MAVPQTETCGTCDGTGNTNGATCPTCKGKGTKPL
jgi:DnaJ-class molecular chaperone